MRDPNLRAQNWSPDFQKLNLKMVPSVAETGTKTSSQFCTKSVANFAYNWSTIWQKLEPKLATYFAQK
jgi:hypothetical protein